MKFDGGKLCKPCEPLDLIEQGKGVNLVLADRAALETLAAPNGSLLENLPITIRVGQERSDL
jgi:hypothetical protein